VCLLKSISLLAGSGTTKLDSGAQKRLRRSRMEGYGPCPQARERLARAAVVPPPSAQASSRTGTAGHCAGQRASPVGTFSKWAILHRFPKSYALRVEIFPDVFYPFTSTYELWTMKSFMEIGPHVFEKSGRQTHTDTDRRGNFIIDKTKMVSVSCFPVALWDLEQQELCDDAGRCSSVDDVGCWCWGNWSY